MAFFRSVICQPPILLDAGNVYGLAMSHKLPYGELQWSDDIYHVEDILDYKHSLADTWWLFCLGLSWRLCDGIQALAFEATYFQVIEALVVERISVSSSCQLSPAC